MDSIKLKENAKEILRECEKKGYTWDDVNTLLIELTSIQRTCKEKNSKTPFNMYEDN